MHTINHTKNTESCTVFIEFEVFEVSSTLVRNIKHEDEVKDSLVIEVDG